METVFDPRLGKMVDRRTGMPVDGNAQPPESVGTLDQIFNGTGVPQRVNLMNEILNPMVNMRDAGTASQKLFDPDSTGWERVGAFGNMASNMAAVLAPVAAAKGAGTKPVDAIVEALTNYSAAPRAMGGEFMADEFGGLKLDFRGDYAGTHTAPKLERGATLDNPADIWGDDIYGSNAMRYFGTGDDKLDRESFAAIQAARKNPDADVMIYRAVPMDAPDDINAGDWVTTSARYARDHGESALDGNYRIVTEQVKAGELATDGNSPHEWGWWPSEARKAAAAPKDPAQTAGDTVLDYLRSGRGSEVTDDMLDLGDPVLNARMSEYLYQNYDLPMDEASRMARAKGMGFDTGAPLYRGDERPDLQSFDTGRLAREGIGVTTSKSPNVAATYMTGDNGAMYPLVSRSTKPINIDAQGRNWTGIPADARANDGTLDNLLDPAEYLDDENLFDFRNSNAVDWGDGTSTDLAITDTNSVSRAAQAKGFDEVRFNSIVDRGGAGQYHTGPANDPQTTVMTADPRNIRSKFARFDPRLAHLKNLSAGVTGGMLLGDYLNDGQ